MGASSGAYTSAMPYFGAWPEAVARLMQERGVDSRRELARRANISPGTVSDYLNRKQEPGVGKVEALLRALGADFGDLHRVLLALEGKTPPVADVVAEPAARYGSEFTIPTQDASEIASLLRRASDLLEPAARRPSDD